MEPSHLLKMRKKKDAETRGNFLKSFIVFGELMQNELLASHQMDDKCQKHLYLN